MNTKFKVGDVVEHLRYGYRGVVFGYDAFCQADDTWYKNNRTQPSRDQPWYHVLVDGGNETYVAEENLELDVSGDKIEHPLVDKVFPTFYSGRYYRQCFN